MHVPATHPPQPLPTQTEPRSGAGMLLVYPGPPMTQPLLAEAFLLFLYAGCTTCDLRLGLMGRH